MSRLGQTVRVSGPSAGAVGGGGGGSSAHITFDNAAVALGNMMGFTANGNATWDWDDEGYFQSYGARANTLVDPAATVAIVPEAGTYRFTIHGEFSITAPNPANTSARAWISIEKDIAGSTWENTEHRIVKLPDATATGGSWDATWIGPLDANGCIAFYSANADDPANDIFNGWMAIEKLGGGGAVTASAKCSTPPTGATGSATWDTLYDVSQSVIGALPAGLGLTLGPAGAYSDALFTATEDGTWIVQFTVHAQSPYVGTVILSTSTFLGDMTVEMDGSGTPPAPKMWGQTCPLLAGDVFRLGVNNASPGSSCISLAWLTIIRIA